MSGNGPVSFRIASDLRLSGTWSFSEQGHTVSHGPGTETVTDVTGRVRDGRVSGTTAQLALLSTLELTEVETVNGVAGKPSILKVTTPFSPPLSLQSDCKGGTFAEFALSIATFTLTAHPTGGSLKHAGVPNPTTIAR